MNIFYTALKEIVYYRLNFLSGIFAAAVAVSCVTGGMILLKRFDLRTEQLVAAKMKEAEQQMAKMQDDYRKITKNMGFNVLILPKKQNLADFYDQHYASEFMPESYAGKLAEAKNIATIRHLLPMLQMKVMWPERKRRVLMIGIRGEMPWAYRSNKKAIIKEVPAGSVALGYELWNSMKIAKNDNISFMGKKFKVATLKPERGTIDDITIWLPLKDAQKLVDKTGQINSMLALECSCALANLAKVRQEIGNILPNTRVLEFSGKALARAEARMAAAKNAALLIKREKAARLRLRAEREQLFSILAPLVVLGCAIWITMLAISNVRERRTEIGLYRALGVKTHTLLLLFLSRAILTGFIGSLIGMTVTCTLFLISKNISGSVMFSPTFIQPAVWILIPLLATFTAAISCWLPALIATGIEPAEILREE